MIKACGRRTTRASEDVVTRRPNNCPVLGPVECNPQILRALKTGAKKADFHLKEVSAEILKAGTIITKSPLALENVVQEDGHSGLHRKKE